MAREAVDDLKAFTTRQTGVLLGGATPEDVRGRIRRKQIRAVRVGHTWLVPRSEIERLLTLEPTAE
jgi:hypothetical protein